MLCMLLSLTCISQIDMNPDLNTNLIVKGKVLSKGSELTRLVVISGFDTIVDKLVKKRYRLSLETNESYEIVFTNNSKIKYVVVDKSPKDGYYVKLDVDWGLRSGSIAFLLYNNKHKEYNISIAEAARK